MLLKINRLTILLVFMLLAQMQVFAQADISVAGRVFDSAMKSPLANATILLLQQKDSTQKAGTISDATGRFVLTIKERGNFILQISLLGFGNKNIPVLVGNLSNSYDLGKIEIATVSKQLEGVTVTAVSGGLSAGLEKKTFDLSKNLSQSGGSVLDAMRNMPGVTIDQEGEISLRGSDQILVLVDGKQSGLTGIGNQKGLENIPASSIEKIEIINNPSAKFDATGMAGVINIIFKKEKKKGFNGSAGIFLGLGELTNRKDNLAAIAPKYSFTPKYNPSVSLNYRADKVNLFLQADGIVRRKVNSNEFSTRIYKNGSPAIVSQFLENRSQQQYSIKGGADWYINDNNAFTFYTLFQDEYHIDRGYVPYELLSNSKRVRLWRWSEDERTYYQNYVANYKHKFAQPGHELSAGFLHTQGVEDEVFPFTDSSASRISVDESNLVTKERVTSFSLDYTKPMKAGRLETGAKLQLRNIPVTYIIKAGANSVLDPNLGKWSNYSEDIYAAYLNFTREKNRLEIEGGLRLEQTNINYDIDPANKYYTKNEAYNYLSLFPNVRFTYKIDDKNKVSLFYNRRVDRAGEFDLRPFPKYDDPEILKVGNPYLRPQFTTTIELAYKNAWQQGSLYVSVFKRFIKNYLYRIYTIDATTLNGIIYAIPQNLNDGSNAGVEIGIDHKITNVWNVNSSVNWYRNVINSSSGQTAYPNKQLYYSEKDKMNTWNAKVNNNFNFPSNVTCQVTAIYYAPDLIPQGTIKERFSLDFGIKKKLKDGKTEISLSGTDLLNTFSIRRNIETSYFNLSAFNYLETQVITLGFNYKF